MAAQCSALRRQMGGQTLSKARTPFPLKFTGHCKREARKSIRATWREKGCEMPSSGQGTAIAVSDSLSCGPCAGNGPVKGRPRAEEAEEGFTSYC